MSKKRIVIANWKMYLESEVEARKFASTLRKRARTFAGVEAWIAPAFPLIPAVSAALKSSTIKIGAQTVSSFTDQAAKAHSGEVSVAMLKSLGASFVIVGHSERRAAGETDEMIHSQIINATDAKMTAVLCVGETERNPDGSHFQEVANQLARALHGLSMSAGRLMVAYEPVWAIGKSAADAMKPEELEETAIFIRKILSETIGREAANKVVVLYGGSVEPMNAGAIIQEGGVSGFLVGHASANVDSFIEILTACKK